MHEGPPFAGSCLRGEQRCTACSPSEECVTELQNAVEARTGLALNPGDLHYVVREVARIRCLVQSVNDALDLQRYTKEDLVRLRSDKQALGTVRRIVEHFDFDSEADRTLALELINALIQGYDLKIAMGEGRVLGSLLSAIDEGDRAAVEIIGSRRKHALDVLVRRSVDCWFKLTGDNFTTLHIGHPDHPGPFLRFLKATIDGRAPGVTLNSLYDKARQLAGRRG